MARVHGITVRLIISLVAFSIASPLLTHFVDKSGVFGVFFVVPLVISTRFWGRRAGFLMAALGVVLNSAVYFALGDGPTVLQRNAATIILSLLAEIIAFAAVVVVIDKSGFLQTQLATSRVDAESARRLLEASENKYRSLIELAPEGVVVVLDGRACFFNLHFLEMSGYSWDELMGMPISRFVFGEDVPTALGRHVARLGGTDQPQAEVLRYVKKNGEVRWMRAAGQRIEWEGEPAVMYFLSDVTATKVLEMQFAQAQKMEAVGRLAGGIAHDFNNILQVVLGHCELMKNCSGRGETPCDAEVIEDAALRAATLTQQLLAFSRKQIVQPRVLDLGEIVQQSERMLNRVLGEDISLTVLLGEEQSCVRADPGQLQQVIMNLAVNARDAMQKGGTLVISVANSPDTVRLTVKDTGCGMDSSTISHLFEPFFTTKEMGKGTGLGLSIVYGIVEQSGGHICVDSELGEGTRFTISLPRAPGLARAESTPSGEEEHHGSGSILVVEDENSVRKMLRTILERGGYNVTEADSGQKAIEIFRSCKDGFNLLLTDLVMPGMRGTEVAAASRS